MMIRSMTVVAFAGLASAAVGQSLDVYLTYDASSIGVGETATATLWAEFDGHPAGAYLSSVNIDLIADYQSVQVSNVAAVAWNNSGLGFDGQGTASGADVLGISAAQFSLIPPVTAGSPILITTFTVTGTDFGPFGFPYLPRYSARIADGAPFAFSVTGGGFDDPVIGYGVDALFPTPGSVMVFAGGACLVARRRRSA